MAFTIYRSTDASAPVLTGQVGTLVSLLDACLVTGYGSQLGAGWTKPFTGTNKAAFRQAGDCQHYLRIQDDGPGAGGAREARITGYESMSDVDTGTNPYPTAAQGVGGIAMVVCRKSSTADGVARPWIVVADQFTFYLLVQSGDTADTYFSIHFGEFFAFQTNNIYRNLIIGRTSENSGATSAEKFGSQDIAINAATPGHFIARGHTWTVGSVAIGKHGDTDKLGASAACMIGEVPFTNPEDGAVYLSPVWLHDPTTIPIQGVIGRLRGFWHFCHAVGSVNNQQTIIGDGELTGKTFLFVRNIIGSQSPTACVATFETSNTLETN